MANLHIHERFTLDADPDLVWSYLIDPTRIVVCLPGAEMLGQEDEKTYSGAVKVKVGAVAMAYRGKVVFEEVNNERRYLRMVGKGREKSGSGTASLTMESSVTALEGGGTEVTVDAEIKIAGKIVRFGRGMIETISGEIFKEFTARLSNVLGEEIARRSGNAPQSSESAIGGMTGGASSGHPPVEDNAVSLFPLLWRAFLTWMKRMVGRG
jgi:uncharacterized protein